MGKKTKIDWCDSTWNPVTGCLHNCDYCYARNIAVRFAGFHFSSDYEISKEFHGRKLIDIPASLRLYRYMNGDPVIASYPYAFKPTFHRRLLDKPSGWKKPRTIFVCSMADLFGDWVPDEWITEILDACRKAPQHRYLFLTKNPRRYIDLARKGLLPQKHWYGYTATRQGDLWTFEHADECPCENLFVSIEPIMEEMHPCFSTHTPADWVIIGAETGNRRDKIKPKKAWIDAIADECTYSGRPIFMKESLRDLMGADFRREYPWEVQDGK